MIVEGAIAVKAALDSKYRRVEKIYIDVDKHTPDVSFIIKTAYHNRITVERPDSAGIQALASGKTHGGIIAEVSPRRFQSITSMLAKEKPFLALVEGVEDSYNLGYIIRSLYAFGCDGLILPVREWDFEDGTMVKSSAGASEFLPIHLSEDLGADLDVLHDNGFKIICGYRGAEPVSVYKTDMASKPVLVCIGGPMRGLSREVLDRSDVNAFIPYGNEFRNALNAASATVVFASEVFRQRSK